MYKIEWNSDLSVGIEEIDTDHKELISIINKIIGEVDKDKDLLLSHFDELEDYTRYHFSREEKLMISQCLTSEDQTMVKKHIKEHHLFIKKIPELRKKIEFSASADVAYEAIDFLVSWLLNHIIEKDLSLSQCFTFKKPVAKQKNKNYFSWLTEKINKHLSLYTKVLILVMIPLLVIFSLLFYQSNTTYNKYLKLGEIENISESFVSMNKLINSLQKERGYSNGWISSKYKNFETKLLKQRKISTASIRDCSFRLKNLKKYMDTTSVIKEIDRIKDIRKKIDIKQLNREEVKRYYTNLISMLIKTIKDTGIDSNQNNHPLVLLLYLKENAGIIRNEGLEKLLLHNASRKFEKHIIKREGYEKSLSLFASDTLLKRIKKVNESDYVTTLKDMEANILMGNFSKYENAGTWFDLNSIKIDAYAQMIKDKLEIINSSAKNEKKTYLLYIGILWSLIIFILFISFILMHALRQSIVKPIEEVTIAMQNLTEGDKSFYFNTYKKNDLMGKMVVAFNDLRRHMIKSDYTSALLDVKDRKVENYEKLSLVDSLTGLYNRRKYIKSLKTEITKSNKSGNELALLIIDLDKFKDINDSFGHDVGDHILKVFSSSLRDIIKQNGTTARIGGEEFAIILPNLSKEKSIEVSQTILKVTRELDFTSIHKELSLRVSIGLAMYVPNSTLSSFIKTTDKNLYQAKNSGRDRVYY